jgi:hypothetical protein
VEQLSCKFKGAVLGVRDIPAEGNRQAKMQVRVDDGRSTAVMRGKPEVLAGLAVGQVIECEIGVRAYVNRQGGAELAVWVFKVEPVKK